MNIDLVIGTVLMILCFLCIYTDLKYGIIRNKYLVTMGLGAVGLNIISYFLNHEKEWIDCIVPVAVGIVITIALYFLKIWAGGDCKLYLVLAMAMPYHIVNKKMWGISLVIYIPVLAFLYGYLYIILESYVSRIRRKEKEKGSLKKAFAGFVVYLKYYIAILFIQRMLLGFFNWLEIRSVNQWLLFVIDLLFVYMMGRWKLLEYRSVLFVLLAADLMLGILKIDSILNRQTILVWLSIILSNVVRNVSNNYNYKEIPIEELKKGMILSTASSVILANNRANRYSKISDESLRARLTEEDVKDILAFSAGKGSITEVSIVKKVPFAMFIALAAITVMIEGIVL